MNIRKLAAAATTALLVGGTLAFAMALPASATDTAPVCVPAEAYIEDVPDITHPAVYETVVVTPAVAASTQWWNFAPNEKGPFEGTPVFPEDANGVWVGPHTEGGPGQDQSGTYQQGQGNGSWFHRVNVAAQDEVTEERLVTAEYIEVTPDIEHAAVTCDDDPEEPTTYTPSCTSVTGAQTITGTGVLSVPGGWASTSISVPFSGTLADIGTVLDIQADPIQYVGLHIRTAEGSIAFEEEPSYGGNLWSTEAWDGVDAGMGYAAFGSISDFIELNGDVVVNGIDLLYTHPEASSTTVESFTIGCTVYTFVPEVVVPEKPADIVTSTSEDTTDCETGVVTTTTTTTTIGTELVDNVWVATEPVVTTATTERDATEVECPVVVPEEPVTPVTTEEPLGQGGDDGQYVAAESLATTGGGDVSPALPIGAAALLLAGVAALAGRKAFARR